MILDMECLCKYKTGLKLTTRNLKWDIENRQVFLRVLPFITNIISEKKVESNLTLISEDVFFFSISPKKKREKLPPFSSCLLPTKNGWTGTPNHSGGTGSPFSRKTCRAWQRGHRIPMESQNMHALEIYGNNGGRNISR